MKTSHFFVYGTLKRGNCRDTCWPCAAIDVAPAWVYGALYDVGPYPALFVGKDRVLGEIWTFQDSDCGLVTETLDEIEGTNQGGVVNLYNREAVTAHRFDETECRAWIYFYANLQQRSHLRYVTPRQPPPQFALATPYAYW
ncbi:gamma-glutamylcyclotransferase family protein [Aureliella helgolandensis]|nr:gamma-glutamylcyclotransferase family protein [Aureliella helgolandensis]